MKTILIIACLIVLLILGYLLYKIFILKKIFKLPTPDFEFVPAIPLVLDQIPGTLLKLAGRAQQTKPALMGLNKLFTIKNRTATGHSFLFGGDPIDDRLKALEGMKGEVPRRRIFFKESSSFVKARLKESGQSHLATSISSPLTSLSLDKQDQFSMSWTTFTDVDQQGAKYLESWSNAINNNHPDIATELFWPIIAEYGLGYNLLIIQKARSEEFDQIKNSYPDANLDQYFEKEAVGSLFYIDMSIFENMEPFKDKDFYRYAPGCKIYLEQDAESKKLKPFLIDVAGYEGKRREIFYRKQSTATRWIYALQAAKTSVTVWGIWLGHVYHWHIVTAAMQMTFLNNVSSKNQLSRLLLPQFNDLMAFDNVLLLLWKEIAPPTSIANSYQFLQLINFFAHGRNFHEDDPYETLHRYGIVKKDFTVKEDWDLYPIAKDFLEIWDATKKYVTVFVDTGYEDNDSVLNDQELQNWVSACQNKEIGNIGGFPNVGDKNSLIAMLTSLLYRITMHGCSRLNNTANPGLTFIANFPPCLQGLEIPGTSDGPNDFNILDLLPKTGTIGEMITFYYTFVFSSPYQSFIPLEGIDSNLFFDEKNRAGQLRNKALIEFRKTIKEFIEKHEVSPQLGQWPLNIET